MNTAALILEFVPPRKTGLVQFSINFCGGWAIAALVMACLFCAVFASSPGVRCNYPVPTYEVLLRFVSIPGVLVTICCLAFAFADAKRPGPDVRRFGLFLMAHGLALLTPTLMEIRADWW